MFEIIKKEYKNSPPTFGSSAGKRESVLELVISTGNQVATEYKDYDVVMNQGIPEIKKVKTS